MQKPTRASSRPIAGTRVLPVRMLPCRIPDRYRRRRFAFAHFAFFNANCCYSRPNALFIHMKSILFDESTRAILISFEAQTEQIRWMDL